MYLILALNEHGTWVIQSQETDKHTAHALYEKLDPEHDWSRFRLIDMEMAGV